jgi:hypothetical protein
MIRTGPPAICRIADPSVMMLFGATEPRHPDGPGGATNAPECRAAPDEDEAAVSSTLAHAA